MPLTLGLLAAPAGAMAHTPPLPQDAAAESREASATPRSTTSTTLSLPDGSIVQVQLDSAHADSGILERLRAALGTLEHGAEMNRLTVTLVDLNGLQQSCGGASSCYYPSQERMVVPVDPDSINMPMPFEMTVAHEYGHHIERNRNFADWYATHYGGRNWATQERVCEGTRAGTMAPGDQGARYWQNPGEAFAQAYAFMEYPTMVPWWWTIASPTQASYDAIRRDIADTQGVSTDRWASRLTPRARRASTTIDTPLDGSLGVRLKQPPGSRFKLSLVASDGTVLQRARHYRARSKKGQATAILSYSVCGTRSVQLKVKRQSGKGKFTAKIERP